MPSMPTNTSAPAAAGNILAGLSQEPTGTVHMPVAKAVTAIASATGAQAIEAAASGASMFSNLLQLTWPNIASFAAALYTFALMTDFCWRKWWRPLLERFGWIKPRKTMTESEWAGLRPNGGD